VRLEMTQRLKMAAAGVQEALESVAVRCAAAGAVGFLLAAYLFSQATAAQMALQVLPLLAVVVVGRLARAANCAFGFKGQS
jgi:Flp pilus assembly protein TadB